MRFVSAAWALGAVGVLGLLAKSANAQAPAKILYLNFDGVTLQGSADCSDAVRNCSSIVNGGTGSATVPPFSGSPDARDAIVAEVKRFYAAFNVHIVTIRPTTGVYSMCVVGGRPSTIGLGDIPAAGVAIIDCNDQRGPSDISFAFSEVTDNDPHAVAVTVGQETAHAYGLSHVEDPTDLLFPTLMGLGSGFQNRESRVCNIDGYSCVTSVGCDKLSTQNSFRLLLENLGAAVPNSQETTPPTVAIRQPTAGSKLGPTFRVEFDAADNIAPTRVELYADGAFVGGTIVPPFAIELPRYFLGEGPHKLKATAYDANHNKGTSEEVAITVAGSIGQVCTGQATGCPADLQCMAGTCTRTCTQKSQCPSNFACKGISGLPSGMGICASNMPPADSGCQMAANAGRVPAAGMLLMLLAACTAGLGRRKRRSCG